MKRSNGSPNPSLKTATEEIVSRSDGMIAKWMGGPCRIGWRSDPTG
ncbi:hypothetical protein [Rhizobium leguminosarum]